MANYFDQFDEQPAGGNYFDQFDAPQQQAAPPAQQPQLENTWRNAVGETAMTLGSGAVAMPLAGLAGLATMLGRRMGLTKTEPADVVRSVEESLTYQPRTEKGQQAAGVVSYPFAKLAEGADWAGGKVTDITGSPGLGAATNTAIQMAPALLLKRPGSKLKAGSKRAASAETAAREWTRTNTSLDWNSLPDSFRATLTEIAADARNLQGLNPAEVQRAARLEALGIKNATRGQITQDAAQLTRETNVSATDAGAPLRDIYQQQNRALIEKIGELQPKGQQVSVTPEGAGQAIQGAARSKLKAQQRIVDRLYKRADAAGETAVKVDATPLIDLIEKTPDVTQYGWAQSWIKKVGVEPGKGIAIRDLESLRQAAVARAMDGGTSGYYAGQLIRAIDQATDGAGGKLYKEARAARKAQGLEFEDQASVARLVENKSRTDPAVPVEQTWRRTVLSGSIEDLRNVKKSLLFASKEGARPTVSGLKAWRAVQEETLRHIIDTATSKAARYPDGTPNITPAALRKAIDSVGDAKLAEIYGPQAPKQLRAIADAAIDLKSQPPTAVRGSPTASFMLVMLERWLAKVPLVGKPVVGVAELVSKSSQAGANKVAARGAQINPLTEAATKSGNALYKRQNYRNALAAGAIAQEERPR